jgi:hypothetical protein
MSRERLSVTRNAYCNEQNLRKAASGAVCNVVTAGFKKGERAARSHGPLTSQCRAEVLLSVLNLPLPQALQRYNPRQPTFSAFFEALLETLRYGGGSVTPSNRCWHRRTSSSITLVCSVRLKEETR